MPNGRRSLLAGRRRDPLSPQDVRRATNTFLGLDENAPPTRYDANENTGFRVSIDERGQEFGEIVFGPDIYPGAGVVDPNSALGIKAAAAHELTHYHRWNDATQLDAGRLNHIDEALTSLEAAIRYDRRFNEHDVRQLISDAIQRLQIYVQELNPPAA